MAYIWVDVGGGNRYAISGTGAGTANDPFVLTFGGGGAGGAVDTELPAAAVLADAAANPTVPGVGCFGLVWNGATWDRLPGTMAGVKSLDAGPAWTTSLGISGARFTSADQSGSAVAVTDAPTSGQKLVITDLFISADTDMVVTFTEETSNTVKLVLDLSAKSPVQFTPRGKFKLGTADKKLKVQTSIAGNIRITLLYYSEA